MKKKKVWIFLLAAVVILIAVTGIYIHCVHNGDYAFKRAVSDDERQKRMQFVDTAISWLGTEGGSAAHQQLLQIYNSHEPLARGYAVQAEDAWCAVFVSAVSIQCDMTDIIPTECGCERQVELFQELGCWEEADDHVPLPGDIIYYCWDGALTGDCTAWSDHVGIVVGTWHGWIKVIEGNVLDRAAYRYIRVDAPEIRGFAIPDYQKE